MFLAALNIIGDSYFTNRKERVCELSRAKYNIIVQSLQTPAAHFYLALTCHDNIHTTLYSLRWLSGKFQIQFKLSVTKL